MVGARWWTALALGAAGVGGGVVVADVMTGEATGQSRGAVGVSAEQLRINQRISQAAVRRSNEGLALLAPLRAQPGAPSSGRGWRRQDLAEDLRESQPRWAVVTADGALARSRGAVAAARTAFGRYRVTFERGVASCALSATIAVAAASDTVLVDRVPTLGIDPADPAVVTVRIYQASNPGNSEDAPFHLTMVC